MSPSRISTPDRKWWKDGVVYQIYPASFKDSNGDGTGDIPGVISKLDYIKSIGIDIVWLCPMYDSPQFDMGYDIANYEDVYPPYGTLADMGTLIQGCHERGMRLILDLVINHTSHEHAWFKESRSSKTNPKRDWYIWRPAKYDANGNRQPPNNWRGNFGGSVWQWDEATEEYYLHLFCPEQPDLNWENPETRQAIYDSAMKFWLDKGVDGFRIDVVNMYSKDPTFVDAPIVDNDSLWQNAAHLYCNGPRMHEFLDEMNTEVLSKYDTMTVGELPATPDLGKVMQYISAKQKQLNMVFQFDVVDLGTGPERKYGTTPKNFTLPSLKKAIGGSQSLLNNSDAWTTVFMENHDQARSISRFASDKPEHRTASGKLLSLMLTALSGTLYIYQGQEIGMINIPSSWPIDEYKDVEAINHWNDVRARFNDDPEMLAYAQRALQYLARDNGRTPVQWDGSANGGFTTAEAKPWMRVNDSYSEINVAQQSGDKNSVLSFWKRMLALRKEYADLFVHGSYEVHDADNLSTYTFVKENEELTALVALNFSEEEQPVAVPERLQGRKLRLLAGTMEAEDGLMGRSKVLAPFEGVQKSQTLQG